MVGFTGCGKTRSCGRPGIYPRHKANRISPDLGHPPLPPDGGNVAGGEIKFPPSKLCRVLDALAEVLILSMPEERQPALRQFYVEGP